MCEPVGDDGTPYLLTNAELETAAEELGDEPTEEQIEEFVTDTVLPNLQEQHDDLEDLAAPEWAREQLAGRYGHIAHDVLAMGRAERIVPEAREHLNACGAGAIAAMLSACVATGATAARVLRHTNSYETLAAVAPQPPVDAVGYASVVVG